MTTAHAEESIRNVTQELSDFETLHSLRVGGLTRREADQCRRTRDARPDLYDPSWMHAHRGGHAAALVLLEEHRATVNIDAVRVLYDRFLAVNQPTKSKCAEWQRLGDDDEEARFVIASDLQDILERVSTTIVRTSALLPRFGAYPPRLRIALDKVFEGQNEFLTGPRVASFHNVWMECHEDYLLTLGISREEEGSY